MRMKKKIKDLSLIALIVLSLVLVLQIWFQSSSLSYIGVGEQMNEYVLRPIMQWFGRGRNGTFSQNIRELMLPKKIVLNQSNQRAVLYSNDDNYYRILQTADDLLEGLMTGQAEIKSKESISQEDYCAVLKGNSVYLDYGIDIDFRLLSVNICGKEKNALSGDFTTVHEYIISLEDNVLNNAVLYIKDYKSGNMLRYVVSENKGELDGMLSKYFKNNDTESIFNYSFELNFHKQEGSDGALSKLVFQPLILFNLVASEGNVVETEPDALWGVDSTHVSGILKAFQINPMTMNKYTDLTNSNIFVENKATLTISPEGYLVYQTIEGGQGLPLVDVKEKNSTDIYTAVSGAVSFLYTLNEEIPEIDPSDLRFCSNLTEGDTPGNYTIEFDLYVGGLPVLQSALTDDSPSHAITMVIENGCLKQYRQFVRKYRVVQKKEKITPVINAVDGLMDQLKPAKQNMTIVDAKKCYFDTRAENVLLPRWEIGVEGINSILTVR